MTAPADTELPNGLRVRRIPIEGTRAVTALVGFEAGSRAELPEENGIAHFLEHLVFKGGEIYPTPRAINATGERIGARIDAWTSQDMVVCRIRSRAEVASEAIDLLTDFVGRPRLDSEELDRERGVVIQEIARSRDRPQDRADDLIERADFGEHPLGRPVLGTEERLRAFERHDVIAFRGRTWSGERGCVVLAGNLSFVPGDDELGESFGRFPAVAPPPAYEPTPEPEARILVEDTDTSQSHLRLAYRSSIDPGDRSARAAMTVFRTLLGGSQGSVLFDEIREQRGLAYSVFAADHMLADGAVLQVSVGLESEKCVETYGRIRSLIARLATDGPDPEHVERARSYAAGRRVLAFENTNLVADHAAEAAILFGERDDPDAAIAALDAVTHEQVTGVASSLGAEPAVACVGPHTPGDFD
jgi:predicted Zn-dependent peptidase